MIRVIRNHDNKDGKKSVEGLPNSISFLISWAPCEIRSKTNKIQEAETLTNVLLSESFQYLQGHFINIISGVYNLQVYISASKVAKHDER